MPNRVLLSAARSDRVRRLVTHAPLSRAVVRRFVAGPTLDDAVRVTHELASDGMHVSLDHLGEDTVDAGQAAAATKAYVELLHRLAAEGLTERAEVSVKLSAVGQSVDQGLALDNARLVCDAATAADTTVTLDMEDSASTDATLATLARLRRDFPATGAVVQAALRRSEADCRGLAVAGSRVRLCKGAYAEGPAVAYQSRAEVDSSYVRCLRVLVEGAGHPMVATHDPDLLATARELLSRRPPGSTHELQMLYGVRPDEQRRLAGEGETVRVYVPYGDQWYGYLMRRLAERPANVGFFLRALATRS